ncbi:MAG: TolC family protein, partial [Planctomycetaceae bacterium]|nr:TolC family protein [Planctomycetaceae bacterium]
NPAIQQASAASARAGGIRTQVGLKPNPTIGYNATQLFDAGTDQHTIFVEQTFVRGDKLAWNRQVISHDVNVMNREVETQRQRVRTDIRVAFFDALAAQQRLELAREFRGVVKEGVSVSEERVKAKVGTRPDILQSEIQLNEVDLSIQQAEFELLAALNELAALAGIPDLGTTSLIGQLDAGYQSRDAESEFSQIMARSPQLAAAQARVDRARANLQRQQVQATPNVTAQLGAGPDNGTGQGLVNFQLSLPLPVHNKNQGNIAAAHAEYCAATQNVQRLRQSVRRELAVVMKEYNIAEATVQQYKQLILPKADETLKLMQEAQDAGEFDFLRVLTARRAYFDANLKYVAAMGRLAQANAKIDGLLLTGGLSDVVSYDGGDDLRGQALSGE